MPPDFDQLLMLPSSKLALKAVAALADGDSTTAATASAATAPPMMGHRRASLSRGRVGASMKPPGRIDGGPTPDGVMSSRDGRTGQGKAALALGKRIPGRERSPGPQTCQWRPARPGPRDGKFRTPPGPRDPLIGESLTLDDRTSSLAPGMRFPQPHRRPRCHRGAVDCPQRHLSLFSDCPLWSVLCTEDHIVGSSPLVRPRCCSRPLSCTPERVRRDPVQRQLRGRQHRQLVEVRRHVGGRVRRLAGRAAVERRQRERPAVQRLVELDRLHGQARVKPLSLGSGGHVALLARASGSTKFYRLALLSGQPVQLQAVNGSSVTVLGSVSRTVSTGTWYTLAIDVNGSTIRGTVDGTQVGIGQQQRWSPPAGSGCRPRTRPPRSTTSSVSSSGTTPPTSTSTTTSRPTSASDQPAGHPDPDGEPADRHLADQAGERAGQQRHHPGVAARSTAA